MKSLSLTPFETYLYHDDVSACPNWQFFTLRCRGSLKRDVLERAWAEATSRQPLWSSVVRKGRLGGLEWALGAGIPPPVHWSRRQPGEEWPRWQPLDLERGPGVRLYVIEGDGVVDFISSIHHAVCDGLALLEVMEDTFAFYARDLGEKLEVRPPPSFDALTARGRIGRNFIESIWIPALQVAGMLAEWRLFRREAAPMLPHPFAPDAAEVPAGWPCVITHRWTVEETNALKNAARTAKVSVAELCLRDFQAAIGSWRRAQGVDEPEAWIRIGTAVSLRQRTTGSWPAANLFGISVIDRQSKTLDRRERLLRRAHEDMALVEKWRLGYVFWTILGMRRWWPGGIRAYARRRVVRMTAVMSYIGKVFAKTPLRREGQHPTVPGAVLAEIQGFAPTRPGTAATVDFALIFGRMNAHLNFDPRVITRPQAEALIEEIRRQLALSLAGK